MGFECLLAGLPDLKAGVAAPISMEALMTQFEETLGEREMRLVEMLRQRIDSPRIDALMAARQAALEDDPTAFQDEPQLSDVDQRMQYLYDEGLRSNCAFVRDWFSFNLDMNNIVVATICRKHGFDVRRMIIGHNEVSEVLRRNLPQKDFGLGAVVDNIGDMMALSEITDLMERERRMDALRFDWLEQRTLFCHFRIENVLAYYLQAEMLNRWSQLNPEQGEKVFRQLVADFKKGIKLD